MATSYREIGLDFASHLSRWFCSMLGCLVGRRIEVLGGPRGVSSLFFQRGDGRRPSLAWRLAFLRYVDDFDILLLEAIKNYVSSSVRGTASSCWKLRSPVTRTTGVFLQGLSCIFSIFQGCLCKNVNFENHM